MSEGTKDIQSKTSHTELAEEIDDYFTISHWKAIDGIRDALVREKKFILLTGSPGSGKGLVIDSIVGSLPKHIFSTVVPPSSLSLKKFINVVYKDIVGQDDAIPSISKIVKIKDKLVSNYRKGIYNVIIINSNEIFDSDMLLLLPSLTSIKVDDSKQIFGFKIVLSVGPDIVQEMLDRQFIPVTECIDSFFELLPVSLHEIPSFMSQALGPSILKFIDNSCIEKIYDLTKGNLSALVKMRAYIYELFKKEGDSFHLSDYIVSKIYHSDLYKYFESGHSIDVALLKRNKSLESKDYNLQLKAHMEEKEKKASFLDSFSQEKPDVDASNLVENPDTAKVSAIDNKDALDFAAESLDDKVDIIKEQTEEAPSNSLSVNPGDTIDEKANDEKDEKLAPLIDNKDLKDNELKGHDGIVSKLPSISGLVLVLMNNLRGVFSRKGNFIAANGVDNFIPSILADGKMHLVKDCSFINNKDEVAEKIVWRNEGLNLCLSKPTHPYARIFGFVLIALLLGVLYSASAIIEYSVNYKLSDNNAILYIYKILKSNEAGISGKIDVIKLDIYDVLLEKKLLPEEIMSGELKKMDLENKRKKMEKMLSFAKSKKSNLQDVELYRTYKQILREDQNSKFAVDGIIEIRDYYLAEMEKARKKGDYIKAEKIFSIVSKIERLDPVSQEEINNLDI